MIELIEASQRLGERTVLHPLTLRLQERRVAVVGGNGSGKSSFARLLNGLRVPTQGRVLVDGLDTRTEGAQVRRRVGFVFQNPDNQIVMPTVEEDLAFGLTNLKLPRREIEARVAAALDRFGLAALRHEAAHHLSGGEKQLLAIAAVLVMEPRYVVLDEPTTLLDLRNKRRIARAIGELEQSAVLVTHDLDLVRDFDRVLVLDEGRILVDDAPSPALARYVERMA